MILLIIYSTNSWAVRSTSFDTRPLCDENKGVWREFGNGCADSCYSKFDKYSICTQELVFSCDCGQGRCWANNKCMFINDYKKIYEKESEKLEKILAKKAEERRNRILNDPNYRNYLQNLYPKPQVNPNGEQNGQNQNNNATNSGSGPQNYVDPNQGVTIIPEQPQIPNQPVAAPPEYFDPNKPAGNLPVIPLPQ